MAAGSENPVGETATHVQPASQEQSAHFHAYWLTALAVLVLCILYHRIPGSSAFPLDDGYISLHSAEVLHWRKDPNFPDVPALAGVTNAPYVALLYLLLFALPPLTALQAASWLGILCYALGLVAICRALRLPWWATAAVAAIGLGAGKISYQLLNGVETGVAMGFTAWIFALAIRNTETTRRWAAFLCGLLPFLRPELAALSGLVLAAIFWQTYRRDGAFSKAARQFVPVLLIAAASALPWLLWYWLSTGDVLPQSIEAKRLFYAEGCLPAAFRWLLVENGARFFISMVGLLTLALVFLVRHRLGKSALLFIAMFFFAYYERFPGALFYHGGRYTYILVPILILGMACGLGDRSPWMRRPAYALLALCFLQTAISFPGQWSLFLRDRDAFNQSLQSVADWTNHQLPPDATLMIHDAGYISYATRFHLVDLVGLKTPSSINSHRALTYETCGAGRVAAISEIARKARPQYLVMIDDWDQSFKISAGLRNLGWGLEEVAAVKGYRVFHLTLPVEVSRSIRAGK